MAKKQTRELPPKLYTYQAAAYLKMKPGTLRKLVSQGRLSCFKIAGGAVRFSEAQLLAIMGVKNAV